MDPVNTGEAYQGSGSRDHCPQPEYPGSKQPGKSCHCDSSADHGDLFVGPHRLLSACIPSIAYYLTSGPGMQEGAARLFVTPIILAAVTTTIAMLELTRQELTFKHKGCPTLPQAQACATPVKTSGAFGVVPACASASWCKHSCVQSICTLAAHFVQWPLAFCFSQWQLAKSNTASALSIGTLLAHQ